MNKIYDLVIKTRSYNDKNGNEKAIWENVGSMIQGNNGPFIMLKAHFNPAALPRKEGSDCITIALFSPKNNNSNNNFSNNNFSAWNSNSFNNSIQQFSNSNNSEENIPF